MKCHAFHFYISDIATYWAVNTTYNCTNVQVAGETGMFPTVEEDPKNMEWNRRIFE